MSKTEETENLVRVARIGKPHGIRGDVTVQVFTDDPESRFQPGEKFLTSTSGATSPFAELTILRARWNKKILLLGFEEFSDRNAAEAHRNVELFGEPMEFIGDDDAWYEQDLLGLEVRLDSLQGDLVGTVSGLITGEAQDLLKIEFTQGGEALLPFVEEIVPEIDEESGCVVITPPAGLLELNQG